MTSIADILSSAAGSTISSTITTPITLGNPYQSPLTITDMGEINTQAVIDVPGNGLIATILVPTDLPSATIVNQGIILTKTTLSSTNKYHTAIYAPGSTLDVSNSGTIISQDGIIGFVGGYVDNSGDIDDSWIGIQLFAAGSVVNTGSIYGKAVGVFSQSVTNSGTIASGAVGLINGAYTAAQQINSGLITAGYAGVELNGGTATNTGTIRQAYGFLPPGGGYEHAGAGAIVSGAVLINAGTIRGSIDAVYGTSVTLVVDPGAVFMGHVVNLPGGGSHETGIGVLELAGTTAASLSGVGSKFTGFNVFSFASGSEWTLQGNQAGLAAGQEIAGFTLGDTIVINGINAKSENYSDGIGLLLVQGQKTVTLDITGNFTTADFNVTASGNHTTIAIEPNITSNMEFLTALSGTAALNDPAASSNTKIFADIRTPEEAAGSHMQGVARQAVMPPLAITTFAASGFSAAVLSSNDLSAQHNAKIAPVLPPGF